MYIIKNGIIDFLLWILLIPIYIIESIIEWAIDCPVGMTIRKIKMWFRETPMERNIRRKVEEANKKYGPEGAEKELLFQLFIHRFDIKGNPRYES
jgi:hypothetical protein